MHDVLVGAAERRAAVSLVVGGCRHRARIESVGDEVMVATTDAGRTMVVGSAAVRVIVVHGPTTAGGATVVKTMEVYDAAAGPGGFTMADILSDRLASRPHVSVRFGGEVVSGTLVAVGGDMATLLTDGAGEAAYVRLDSTAELSVSDAV